MKLSIQNIISIWNQYNKLLEKDINFPVMFEVKMTRNIAMIGQIALQVRQKTKAEREKIASKKIELALSPLSLEDLPEKVPAGTLNAFQSIIEDYEFEPEQLNVEELLNGTNGQSKSQAKPKAESKD